MSSSNSATLQAASFITQTLSSSTSDLEFKVAAIAYTYWRAVSFKKGAERQISLLAEFMNERYGAVVQSVFADRGTQKI